MKDCVGSVGMVDLTKGSVGVKETPTHLIPLFLGGRGLNVYYLNRLLPRNVDPLASDNVLIIGNGLLTGTPIPNACRFNVTAKSPESGILGDANCGGFFGPKMRFAGFDRLVITGKSPTPCYIMLEGGRAEIREARDFWGLNVPETIALFKERLGSDVEVACIGPAGENLVRFAAVMTGPKNAAARCGMGAVFGSKGLKAVVARGKGPLDVHDRDGLAEKRRELTEYLKASKIVHALGTIGTPLLYDPANRIGTVRTLNSQRNLFEESLRSSEFQKLSLKMVSCWGCIVHCRHRNVFGGEGPDYSTLGLLGANLGIADPRQVVMLNNQVNELGLDASSTGTILSWAIELCEKGLIGHGLTGRRLRFGDFQLVSELINDVAYRRGFGEVIAESTRAVEVFGEESRDFLIAIKGLPQSDPHDVRYVKSFALGIAVASRGADHLRNRPTLDFMDMPEQVMEKVYGRPIDPDPGSYQTKEAVVHFSDNIFAAVDSLGICKFVCHGFNSPHLLGYRHFAEVVALATGIDMSPAQIEAAGKRIIDLERVFNMKEGMTRLDDTLPKRYFDEPMPLGLCKGHYVDRREFANLLTRYYRLKGWDEEGRPSRSVIDALESLT